MTTVLLSTDPLSVESYERHEVEDVREFLIDRFGERFPATARIYHQHVAQSCDVTPSDEATIAALGTMPGPFFVIVYPATGAEAMFALWLVTTIASVAMSILLRPKLPQTKQRRNDSPNNALSSRSNQERVGARIPDIFGKLRATPDLLAVPYSVFDAHEEVEHSLLCIGRGAYEVEDAKDGATLISTIRGAKIEVYEPDSTVGAEDSQPQVTFPSGVRITEKVLFPMRSAAVTGQDLSPTSDKTLNESVYFKSPDTICLPESSLTDFQSWFSSDGKLTISGAGISTESSGTFTLRFQAIHSEGYPVTNYGAIRFSPGQVLPGALGVGTEFQMPVKYPGLEFKVHAFDYDYVLLTLADGSPVPWRGAFQGESEWEQILVAYPGAATVAVLDGTYDVIKVESGSIVLDAPEKVNADWQKIASFADGIAPPTPGVVPVTLSMTGLRWVGPFTLEYPNFSKLALNFVADSGIYTIGNDGKQYGPSVDFAVEVTQLDASGNDVAGTTEYFGGSWAGTPLESEFTPDGTVRIDGSAVTRRTRALTAWLKPSWAEGQHPGKCRVAVARVTPSLETEDTSAASDGVKWRDLYAMAEHGGGSFGDVTVVRSLQRASEGAFALKERRLNMLVTRKVPKLVNGGFTDELYPTRSAADIFCAVALDPKIGSRNVSELDVPGIYAAVEAVKTNFSYQDVVGEFAHTFDDLNTSFEETASAIANAAFCVAYRQGAKIRLKPELPTLDSVLLFNHRNKLPGTETRTIRFGTADAHDGIEFEYTSPKDDSRVTLYLPEDMSARNPERIESVGIRSRIQAYYHATRLWMKQQYQRVAVEFEATQEADLLVPGDRILVADNTRPDVQDGEVLSVSGLVLELSQPVSLGGG